MADPPKKNIVTGIDIDDLGKVRPTKIPSARNVKTIHKQKIRWRRIGFDAAILAIIILVAYAASLIGDFVFNDHYIDKLLIFRIADESFWSNLVLKALTQPLSQSWTASSFAFDWQNFGLEAIWYHIVNLILHFLSCFYFYILAYRLAKRFWSAQGDEAPIHAVPLLAASLLACHPLACESVAHISGRVATLTACNVFLALNFFLSGLSSRKSSVALRHYLFTFIFFALAIFTDCQSLALPAIMILLVLLLKESNLDYKSWLAKNLADFIFVFFLIGLVIFSGIKGFTTDFSNGFALPEPSRLSYVSSQFHSLITYYLRCFIFPIGLSIYPPFTKADGALDIFSVLGVIVLMAGFYFVYKWRKEPLAAFGLGLAVLSYLPQIFFVQNEIAADRRFYLCIAGLSLLIAAKVKNWFAPNYKDYRIRACACLLLTACTIMTIARTFDFRSDTDLLGAAKRVNAKDAWVQGMLGLDLVNTRKNDQGIIISKKAIAINDACQPAHLALGTAYLPTRSDQIDASDKYKKAKVELEKAWSLAKSQHLGTLQLFETQVSLASALVELKEYSEAKALVADALTFNANSVVLNLLMGRCLNGTGNYFQAFQCLDKVFSRDRTNPDLIEPLAEAGLGMGTPDSINTAYNIAKIGLRVKQDPNLHLLFARAALSMIKLKESMQWTDTVLQEEPNNPKAIYLRSFQFFIMHRPKEGLEWRSRALKLQPDLVTTMRVVAVRKDKNTVIDLEKNVEQFIKSKPVK